MSAATPKPRSRSARARASLPPRILGIVSEELERAFYECGRKILSAYLEELTRAQVAQALTSTENLTTLFEEALTREKLRLHKEESSNPLAFTPKRITARSQDILLALEAYVRTAPVTGIPMRDARQHIIEKFNYKLTIESLAALISRNKRYHKLAIRHQRVCLRADLMVDLLEGVHRAQKHAKTKARLARIAADRELREG